MVKTGKTALGYVSLWKGCTILNQLKIEVVSNKRKDLVENTHGDGGGSERLVESKQTLSDLRCVCLVLSLIVSFSHLNRHIYTVKYMSFTHLYNK